VSKSLLELAEGGSDAYVLQNVEAIGNPYPDVCPEDSEPWSLQLFQSRTFVRLETLEASVEYLLVLHFV
jgi:hypothetical protein